MANCHSCGVTVREPELDKSVIIDLTSAIARGDRDEALLCLNLAFREQSYRSDIEEWIAQGLAAVGVKSPQPLR